MPAISSPGIGSGLDVSTIVSQLVAAEREPQDILLTRREADINGELTALGTMQSAISAFDTALTSLNSPSVYQAKTVSTSDKDVITATTSSAGQVGNYTVQVTTLAKAHKLRSTDAFANTNATIGTGKLTFQFGTYSSSFTPNGDHPSQSVTITSSNQTLEGVRDAVNEADIGVTASIINDGSATTPYILVFTSKHMGADNTLKVTVDDDDAGDTDTSGLSQLSYDPAASVGSGKNMLESVAGTSASIIVDGITITKDSNSISDVIEGVTLNLVKTDAGVDKTITVAEDKSGVENRIDTFISSYNEMVQTFQLLTSYDPETGDAGLLLGDSTLRNFESQSNLILSNPVENLILNSSYTALSQIGIKTNSSDLLAKDDETFDAILSSNFEDIAAIFAPVGTPTDSLIDFVESTDDTVVKNYAVNITTVATQGTLVGSAAIGSLVITTSNNKLNVELDGQTQTVTIPTGTYASNDILAAEVQSQLNGSTSFVDAGVTASVSVSAGVVTITSDQYGSSSSIDITGGNGETNLMGSSATATTGVDVAGTLGGTAGIGAGRFLTGVGDARGMKIEVKGGSTGSRGAINFTRGVADQFKNLIESFTEKDGVLDFRQTNLRNPLDEVNQDGVELNERMADYQALLLKKNTITFKYFLVAGISSTGSFLDRQLGNLPGFTRNNS